MNNKQLFKDYLLASGTHINTTLTDFFTAYAAHVQLKSSLLVPLYEQYVMSVSGGKMLRGTLVQLGYLLSGKQTSTKTTSIAAAFEVLHTSLLVHDDIIDKSPTRRGKPSLHKSLGASHYGISQAICLGDLGFFMALQLLTQNDFPLDVKMKIIEIFTRIESDTVLGEMLDVKLSRAKEKVHAKDIIAMNLLKTAHYTIVGPLTTGAIAGGAKKALVDAITVFGENAGIAFQLQDDLLGIFGQEADIGKSIYSDIEEGKQTLLLNYCLEKASAAQLQFIESYYGKGELNQEIHRELLHIFEVTGAKKYVELQVKNYCDKAVNSIKQMTTDPYLTSLLHGCVTLLLNRTK
jgi:geranylgeranyl diphosphate synthase type II